MYHFFGFLSIKRLPEFLGSNMGFCFEQFAEGLQMFKTQFVGNFTDGFIGLGQFVFCQFNEFIMNMLLGTLTGQIPK